MTKKEKSLCNMIIHSASAASGAVDGRMIRIPMSDNMVITPIRLGMAIALAKIFDITLSESAAKTAIAMAESTALSRLTSLVAIRNIPRVSSNVEKSITEAMGWKLAEKFEMQKLAGRSYE